MDTAVKERLVGAAILVVIVVLVVPAFLRGPRPPPETPPPAGDTRVVEINLAGRGGVPREPTPADPAPTGGGAESAEPAALPAAPPLPQPAETTTDPGAAVPAPVTVPPPQPVVAPAAATGWAVQVAALSKAEAAERMATNLRQKGYPAFVLEHAADGKVLYRVRVGPEPQRDRAEALARRLQGEGFKPTVVSQP